jgi:NAD(P)H-flavin reductase
MYKIVSTTLIATTLLIGCFESRNPVLADTCASKCGASLLQFTPGQLVQVEVLNRTPRLLQLQRIETTESMPIQPGQVLKFEQAQVTEPNMSLLFWDDTGRALKVTVSKPNLATLRIELRPSWQQPGDRSVYLRDDGMVNVL